jgi:hypothetical protein
MVWTSPEIVLEAAEESGSDRMKGEPSQGWTIPYQGCVLVTPDSFRIVVVLENEEDR